tara:strand:+ start:1678 stop:9723 length:8046 start_codon:yes stop_codon:yes gene_type:complete
VALDIQKAIEAGYTEGDIALFLSQKNNFDLDSAFSQGYTAGDVIQFLGDREDTTMLGAVSEFAKGVPRGVANSLISTGEGLFQLADAGLNLVGLENAIDDEDEDYLLNLARQGREAINESALGVDQRYQDSFGTKFGEGLGSFFTFLGPGLIGKVAGLSGKGLKAAQLGGAGTLAVGAGAGDQSQRIAQARAQGMEISPETEDAAISIGGAIGLTELAPVERLFRGLPGDVAGQSLAKSIMPRITSAAKTGGVEGVQEVTAGLLQDFTARGLYDPNTPVGESAWDDLTVGGAVGAAADLVVNYAAGRRKAAIDQASLARERELREEEEAQEQARREARSMPVAEEEIDVINVEPATVPFTTAGADGVPVVEQRLAGGNAYKATAIEIFSRMGRSFPMYENFSLEKTGAESSIVVDSQGKQYGPEYADPREAVQLAGALNEQALEQTLEQNNLLAISESGIKADEEQKRSLLTLGRQVLGADRNTYNKSAVDYAAGTTTEEGFADDLTAQQAIDAGVKLKDMSASQRLNAARLKKGLPETDRFSLSEVRKVIGDNVGRLAEFESGASDVDTLRAFQRDGVPMVSIDRAGSSTGTIDSRPATAQEKEIARSAGKRAPSKVKFTSMRDAQSYAAFMNQRKGGSFISSAELFGDIDLSRDKFDELLAAKNIDMDYTSPEMRQIAQRYTGRKLRRDQSINDLTKEERQLLYYKLRQAPRFNKPTQIPIFDVKPYSSSQLQLAVDYLREQGSDMPKAAFEFRGIEIKPAAYEKVVKKAREIAPPPAPVNVEESQILALPAPDQRRQAMAKAIEGRLAQVGISGDVTAKLVDRVRDARVDAEGNIVFSDKDEASPARGAYSPSGKVMQVSFDNILAEAGPDATDVELETAILGTFNHELTHAIRALDLITQEELELLERASRKYRPAKAEGYEAGDTFVTYTQRQYGDRSPVVQAEEAVAELIKYGYQNRLIDERGNLVKLSGKPRSLMRRIMDFFKQMIGFTRGVEANNFSDFLIRLESGEVGARERGEIRTLYRMEREAKVVPERGITATRVAADTSQKKLQEMGDQPDIDEDLLDRPAVNVTQRVPEVTEAAQQLQAGQITKQEYNNIVGELKPVEPYEAVPAPASPADAKMALATGRGQSPEKAAKYGLPAREMKRGEDAQLRLDIPSYTNHGTWVVSVHRPKGQSFQAGPIVGYESTGAVTDASFGVVEKAALSIAAGKPKGTIATVRGKWSPMSRQAAKKAADDALTDPSWTQVGMDPFRHSYFYDRNDTAKRVVSADEVIQVGPLVLAKNAKTVDAMSEEETLFDRSPTDAPVDIIDVVSGAEQPPKLKGKKAVAGYLQRRTLEKLGGVPRNIAKESDREAIANDLAREAIFEFENQESAVEWYNETIDKTIEMLAEVHPEIKTDPGSRAAFLMSLSITSQNLAVPDNLAFAEQSYNYYKKNGKFKVEGKGDKKKSMESNFTKANKLLAKMTPVEIEQFLRTEFVVKDLNKASRALLGKQADTGELAENTVYGSAIFGPKIGNGFYTNLRGDFSPVTMDMWFMRTMGRLAGTLTSTSKAKLDNAYKRLATAVGKKRVFKDAIERQAREIKSKHESDYRKYAAEFKSGKREKNEKTLAAENLIKLLDGTNDVPMNGTHRNQLRDTTYRAIKKFEEATGVSIEPAAFQALIWYPEQDLYKSLGVNLRHVRQDYATSTENYLLKIGVDRSRIERAKNRVRRRAERGPDGVRRGADVGGPDRRGAGRLDSDLSATDQLEDRSARQIDPAKVEQAVQQNLEAIDKTQGPPRFSVKASPEAQYIGRNPEAALSPDDQLYDQPAHSPEAQLAIDKLTKGPDQEEANGKVFMGATNTGPLGTMFTKFKQLAINRYAGLEKYYQKNPMLRELEADSSAMAAVLFADRAKGILASAVKDGVPVYENGLTKVVNFSYEGRQYRGLLEVMSLIYNKDVGDLRKLAQSYAMIERGKYLDSKGLPNPVDAKSRDAILQEIDALTDVNGYNPVRAWHNVWQAYNDKTIEFLKNTGILNDQTADAWKASSYVPFYRQAQGDVNVPKVASGVFGDLTHLSSFKEYKGSEKAVDVGLIESISLNLGAAVEMGMRNVAQQRIARDMQSLGLARQVATKPKLADGIKFKVNGQPVQFQIDDNLIYSSMETLGGGAVTDVLTKVLGFPSMILRETVTRDPGFMIANLMRDTLSTAVTSGSNFIPVFDSLKGLTDGMNRLERVGVVGGYDYSRDPDNVVKFFTEESRRRGIGPDGGRGGPLGMFSTVWRWAGDATTASDAATRNAVYNDVLARTGNEAEAAFQALEVINFSRRGAHPLARVITAAIPFLNARFQGLDVFMRAAGGNYSAVKNPRGKTVQRFVTRALLLSGMSAIYYMLVSDDDQYKEQSDEVRDNNWLLPTSWGVPIRIPIPFEVGLLFKTVPETIMAATLGDKTAPEVRETITRGVVSTLEINPLGAQAIAPIVEASLNHNFFTGRSIVPYYIDQKITGGLQDSAGTTEMGKYIGQALNISPMKVDHVMFGYTGTIGGYVLNLADRGLKTELVQGEGTPLPPSKSLYEFPLWRRFFGQREGAGLREDAYQLYDEVSTVLNTINRLKKDGRVDDLNAYIASRRHLVALKEPVYSIKRKLDMVRNQKRKVINADMDPDQKREMIDDLDAQLNEYLKVMPRLQEMADLPFVETTF